MAKLGKYILIPIFFVFVMSHNAFAAQTVLDITNYDVVRSAGFPKISCTFSDSTYNVTNVSTCQGTSNGTTPLSLQRLYTNDSYSFKYGDVVEYDLLIYSPTKLSALDGVISALGAAPEYPFRSLSFEQTAHDVFTSLHSGSGSTLLNGSVYYSVFHYSLMYVGPNDGVYPLGRNTGYSVMFNWFDGILEFRLVNFIQYRAKGKSQVNQEQEEAAEDAAADSQTSGSSSQNDATSATSSLISVITSGIGAITSASASNCVINADMGNFDMGSIDLCANPVPTFMQVIGSIIAALVVLPLVIVLFNRFIAIIGSFQR